MKIETYEKAQKIMKSIKVLEGARDVLTEMIDRHSGQLDLVDDNDAEARQELDLSNTRAGMERDIAKLRAEFDAL